MSPRTPRCGRGSSGSCGRARCLPGPGRVPTPRPTSACSPTSRTALDDAARANPDPGRTETFRRLNRTEYQNAVRDLLALEIDVTALLPRDDAAFGFDNVNTGGLSPTLMERYLAAARTVSELAVGSRAPAPGSRVVVVPADRTQEDHVAGLPFGTRGGTVVEHVFPFDGEYEIQVRLQRNRNENVEGLTEPHDVELTLDGERLGLFTMEPSTNMVIQANATYYADEGIDNHLNVRLPVTAGPHRVGAAFIKKNSALLETTRQPYDAHYNMDRHPRQQPAVRTISIAGPFDPTGIGGTPSRDRIFSCRPADDTAGEAEACATGIIASLARRAYRRPVTFGDIEQLAGFYREGYAEGGFEAGVETALRALLTSPEFLFRIERDPAGVEPGTAYRVGDLELASRLSFFLWSSLPDDELIDVAAAGRLREPEVLRAQVQRMLTDPRAGTLTTNFASQWLHLRNLDAVTPDARNFPDFDDNLRQGFRTETQLVFRSVVEEDRSLTDLLTADYTFLNERLATHYGVPGIYGDHFRRVALPAGSPRAGVLGHGSILTVTSYATRTSPVLRGKWILENLLGTPPPPPAAQRSAPRGERVVDRRHVDARADGGASAEPRLRGLPPHHGSGGAVDGELRRHRPVARHGERGGHRRVRQPPRGRALRRRGRSAPGRARPPGGVRRHRDREAADLCVGARHRACRRPRGSRDRRRRVGRRLSLLVAHPRYRSEPALSDEEIAVMMITKTALPRRTFLRGAGATLALPLLDAMVPAASALANTAAAAPRRLGYVYIPMGMNPVPWTPSEVGRMTTLSPTLSALLPNLENVTVVTNLEINDAHISGNHASANSAFLTCVRPKRTEGSDYVNGTSVDQIAARKVGGDTPLPSLEIGTDLIAQVGNCDNGFACAYMNSLSWASPTAPNPTEADPRIVFERLFGKGGTPEQRKAQLHRDRSILDWVLDDMSRLQSQLGAGDRNKVSEYLDTVREVERRIERAEASAAASPLSDLTRPTSVPDVWEDHVKLMYDLQVLALRADLTRVVTFQMAREASTRTYPQIGVPEPHHPTSHHLDNPEKLAQLAKINQYHVSLFAYMVDQLKATEDGDGSLLDHTTYMLGSGLGNPNVHDHRNLPIVVASGAGSRIAGGRHVKYDELTPMANLHLTLLDDVGVHLDDFADSTGRTGEIVEPLSL